MTEGPTPESARQSLSQHVAARGAEINGRYGPRIGWNALQRLLTDRECVRYPCELVFDAAPLEEGEMAFPQPLGEAPEDGFRLCVHPCFATDPQAACLVAAYQLVAINYGPFAAPDDAEIFGAALLGMDRDAYYQRLCELADRFSPDSAC